VQKYYDIPFSSFAILAFHPVTTETDDLQLQISALTSAVRACDFNFVVIYPNNDHGSQVILDELLSLQNLSNVRVIPSIRFEAFQTLL
ncbi:UDP-N-acetylglucosamine 2-epimerase, partial [Vibrio parahaemolyticus]|uniref:UDP-N-acetylglucosamine 2-epimerase n=1 Tax=Vibrio parahaemolyticus TaxID=670 RepID=UPI0021126802